MACRAYSAMTLWLLGYPEQALVRLHEALALAHALSHPYSLAFAQSMAAWVSQVRRDVPAVHAHAEACIALATAQGFPLWAASGTILRGWALAMQTQDKEGLAQLLALKKFPRVYVKISHLWSLSKEEFHYRDTHDRVRQLLGSFSITLIRGGAVCAHPQPSGSRR